ncbi:MAG TPA: hypothetical protein VMY77_00640 [Chitinophagaceae bacterium]|nr:hypothetical protein [Chitinophagaceae bacterium]
MDHIINYLPFTKMSKDQNIPAEESTVDSQRSTERNALPHSDSQLPTTNYKPQTEDMEVHHPHHVTHKKKWTEYLLEFFMLFLAVFLGFLAENQREHTVEKQRAREYAMSLTEDLKKDTAAFTWLRSNYAQNIGRIDSFRRMINEQSISRVPSGALYYYCEPALWSITITFHDATIQQLKNSGSLRYFPPDLQYTISEYDRKARELTARQENELYFSRITREMMSEIFDSEILLRVRKLPTAPDIEKFKQSDFHLNKKDTLLLVKLVNEIILRHASWQLRLNQIIEPANDEAIRLLKILRNEYRFE